MEFTAEVYKEAAREHAPVAGELYDEGHYVLANYVSGVAVEAVFRAYRFRIDPVFDSRHDLMDLYRKSRFEEIIPVKRLGDYMAHVSTVVAQWSNSHRYRSEKALRAHLKKLKLDRVVRKGDFLKELTRRIVHAAAQIVSLGVEKWPA